MEDMGSGPSGLALSLPSWEQLIKSYKNLSQKNQETSLHACASQKLHV